MPQKDISIVLAGQAGQGIDTIETVLVRVLKNACYNVFATKEFMSRVRLGQNSTEIRVSYEKKVNCYVDRIDLLVALERTALERLAKRVRDETVVLCDQDAFAGAGTFVEMPFAAMATEIGDKIFTNTIAIGAVCGILGVDTSYAEGYLRKEFADKKPGVVEKNLEALAKGYGSGQNLASTGQVNLSMQTDACVADDILVHGAEAIALGCIAGGCNFIGSYPMSPSTEVLTSLAEKSRQFDLIAEQAEDEISALNMAIGAWYAGARALVTTSGGGFDLMCEAVSLAGMTETPVVIHIGQRPGPATGLPTRTEQGDLNLVRYAGHGEFPRVIFAPATVEDGFMLAQKAFNLADKYQVPVFLLTDQYYIDSYYNMAPFSLANVVNEHFTVETTSDYHRYTITKNGISPRGIPLNGSGFVLADSDEHDESGHITEDYGIRIKMMDKRLRKLEDFVVDEVPPRFNGQEEFEALVIGWGSTGNAIDEALEIVDDPSISHLQFTQVYPLPSKTKDYLAAAKKLILIEQNATAQFGQLLKLELGIDIPAKILKYSGEPFHVEELVKRIKEMM